MSTVKTNSRFNNIIKNLSPKENKDVLTAIKQLRKHGKAEAITHLVDLYKKTTNEEIKISLQNFFFDLKEQSATEALVEIIETEDSLTLKAFLISILWQSSLDASEHLPNLISQAINGDYMVCVEVLTVIDSFETTFQEQEIQDLDFDLAEAIDNNEETKDILIAIKNSLTTLNIEF